MTSLKVSSSYRSFTALSMATLPPSRSSCMAAMCFFKIAPLAVDLGLLLGDLAFLSGDLLLGLANVILHSSDLGAQHTDLRLN